MTKQLWTLVNNLLVDTKASADYKIALNQDKKIITWAAAACLALSICIVSNDARAEWSTTPVVSNNNTVILAQANTQETDGKIYTAEVIQIDGSKKVVTYFRDIRWAIIAPLVTDGKLVDGSEAPSSPVEARVAQKKILVKYDKNAQIMLALVSKDNIIGKADDDLSKLLKLANTNQVITTWDIHTAFYSIYVLQNGWVKFTESMKWVETIARLKVKLSDSEISSMKQDAESKAKNIWKSTTGAILVD